ncbi:acyl-CoA dehydrogenase family protein [Achromobacter pestifer]|uniref:Acyl-[acyl-carrier-protein] dehydrogenase MbtN n=1 Tax=Achromobacter pestifer TaxID=1353889 RepID=A0A7D4IRT4_9BURK|nr:acyl-CoA dehydrogenase family protein [Achromobacter pestifer]QKH39784.1 acyl-CoA dehydrogenase family protein [Achromobacter pestifer]
MDEYQSPWHTPEIEQFQHTARRYWTAELLPRLPAWEAQGHIDREVWNQLGAMGFLLADLPSEHGGGDGDYAHLAALVEVSAECGFGPGFGPHYIVGHYLHHYGSEEQKRRWLPGMASGDIVASIGMTEPGAGSDLQGIRTRARRDGDSYVISGSKTFNTNGLHADLVMLAVKTDASLGAKGVSLLMVETGGLAGFRRGEPLDKIGLKAQDTVELFFDEARVPAANLLGVGEGRGFAQMMAQLPYERLLIGIRAVGSIERALRLTLEHVHQRQAFGQPLFKLQNTRFEFAEMKTEATLARVFIDQCIAWQQQGKLDAATAAMAKWWGTQKECETVDRCLQLFGGYGFMREYPIARMYMDSRGQKIYGGANEVMKEIIARQLAPR